ncbi:MAG: hypothetical protein G01um101429_1022, partial [Parcubacteria group bacterium Gr01-1014_29]
MYNKSMKNKFIFLAVLCALVITSAVFYRDRIARAVGCNRFTSPSTPPLAGFGFAFDVFEPTRLLLNVTLCSTTSVTLEIANKGTPTSQTQITFVGDSSSPAGHILSGSTWVQIPSFSGGTPYKDTSGMEHPAWRVGTVTKTFSGSEIQSGMNYVLAYVCTNRSGVWKCGCSDTTCATGKWQLQGFNLISGTGGREPHQTLTVIPLGDGSPAVTAESSQGIKN